MRSPYHAAHPAPGQSRGQVVDQALGIAAADVWQPLRAKRYHAHAQAFVVSLIAEGS